MRDWVAAYPGLIELHFLRGYSPELNPAEMLNQDAASPTPPHRLFDTQE